VLLNAHAWAPFPAEDEGEGRGRGRRVWGGGGARGAGEAQAGAPGGRKSSSEAVALGEARRGGVPKITLFSGFVSYAMLKSSLRGETGVQRVAASISVHMLQRMWDSTAGGHVTRDEWLVAHGLRLMTCDLRLATCDLAGARAGQGAARRCGCPVGPRCPAGGPRGDSGCTGPSGDAGHAGGRWEGEATVAVTSFAEER